MRPYTQPDFDKSLESLRAEVKRDYEQMCKRFKLPEKYDFSHACQVVLAGGMGFNDGSPYEIFRDGILDTIATSTDKDDELRDVFEILTGVWNHFPHKDLDGLSPIEKMREEPALFNSNPDDDAFLADIEKYSAENDRVVSAFSKAVAVNLEQYLKVIGLGKKDQQHILRILSDPDQNPETALLYLITKMMDLTKKEKLSLTIDDIQPVVRALMWCENHTASKMPNGHWNSRMFQSFIEQAMEFNTASDPDNQSEQPEEGPVMAVDPFRAYFALSLIHDEISDFREPLNMDIGIEEATRHLVDWLALTDMHELLSRKDLAQSALYFIGAARLIAITGNPKRPYKSLEKSLLKELAPQVKPTVFAKEIKRIAEKALNVAQDPIMLMPYPGQEPDDCFKRLTKLAPDLKLRAELDDDMTSVPSPFFP